MSTDTNPTGTDRAAVADGGHDTGAGAVRTTERTSWWHGRGELGIGIAALVGAGMLILGTVTMNVRGDEQPGPQFFPIIVICLLVFTGGWITVQNLLPRRDTPEVWHRPDISEDMLADVSGTNTEVIALEHRHRVADGVAAGVEEAVDGGADQADEPAARGGFDWRTFGIVLGAVVVFAALLVPVGWILSAAFLFWAIAYALGSTRPIFDIGVALVLSSLVQLAFSAGLGLALPSGFIGWIF